MEVKHLAGKMKHTDDPHQLRAVVQPAELLCFPLQWTHAFAKLLTFQIPVKKEFGHTDNVMPNFNCPMLVLLLQWPLLFCRGGLVIIVVTKLPAWKQPHFTGLMSWCCSGLYMEIKKNQMVLHILTCCFAPVVNSSFYRKNVLWKMPRLYWNSQRKAHKANFDKYVSFTTTEANHFKCIKDNCASCKTTLDTANM